MDKFIVKRKRKNEEVVGEQIEVERSTVQLSSNTEGVVATLRSSDTDSVDNAEECSENSNSIKITCKPANFERWQQTYKWLQLNSQNRAICSICSEACEKKLIIKFNTRANQSKQAWVDEGFCNWKHAAERIKSHSLSALHIESVEKITNLSSTNIVEKLSTAHQKQMMENRTALKKIFSSLLVLAQQGLPIRGHNDDKKSNFLAILNARAEDVPELNSWLKRNGHKWFHHEIQNEILHLMAAATLSPIMEKIRNAEFFSILLDETADVASVEQVSICLRYVAADLSANEYFISFFSTPDTKAQTLYELVKTVLEQYKLPLCKLRGQCYDGASNVSGKISGLQRRIRAEEPRALFVHCNAHNLNLVVQDSLQRINVAQKFIGMIKELINFVRDSPKRLLQFKQFQNETELEDDTHLPHLAAYCPTRWVLRVKSLKAVRANYAVLLKFLFSRSKDKEIDSSVSAKALGFFDFMASFECFFMLNMMIEIFNRIEILNTELQKSSLSVIDSFKQVDAVRAVLEVSRERKFEEAWNKSLEGAVELELDDPTLPRQRKITKRLEQGTSEGHVFKTPKDYYRKNFFEVYDQLVESLKSRFDNDSAQFFKLLEQFTLCATENVDEVCKFYDNDFDKEQLLSDRDMFWQLVERQHRSVQTFQEVVNFLKDFEWCKGLVPEFTRFVKLLITIPGSSCSNERSFSVLRRLKNYLRSTMLQDRLNDVAILNVYSNEASKLDLESLMNEFIKKSNKRSTVFALNK